MNFYNQRDDGCFSQHLSIAPAFLNVVFSETGNGSRSFIMLYDFMEEICENKVLGITVDDVNNETDLTKLESWRDILDAKNRETRDRLKTRREEYAHNMTEANKAHLIRLSDFRNYNISFVRVIHNRIKVVKKEQNPYGRIFVEELKQFRKIAKEVLDSDIYESIKAKSKELAKEKLGL